MRFFFLLLSIAIVGLLVADLWHGLEVQPPRAVTTALEIVGTPGETAPGDTVTLCALVLPGRLAATAMRVVPLGDGRTLRFESPDVRRLCRPLLRPRGIDPDTLALVTIQWSAQPSASIAPRRAAT